MAEGGMAPGGASESSEQPTQQSSAMPGAQGATPSARSQSGGKLPWVIASVAIAIAVGLALYFTVFSGSDDGDDEVTAYQAKVHQVLRPVVAANRRVSGALDRLDSERSKAAARRAVAAAQDTTVAARGGLNALTVPSEAQQTAVNARGTLTREEAYLQAIAAGLRDPSSASLAQTQTLASNLTDALNVITPSGQDWSQSVSGADVLTAWASREVAAERRKRRQADDDPDAAPTTSTSAPAPPPSSGTDCGGGLRAGPNTSCPFAANVRDAYNEAPGSSATVQVYSPVTGQTYSMSCAPAGSGVTCSGGNNASVSWTY